MVTAMGNTDAATSRAPGTRTRFGRLRRLLLLLLAGLLGLTALGLAAALAVYPVEYVRRTVLLGDSDVGDQYRFAKREIAAAAGAREPPSEPQPDRVRAAFAAARPGPPLEDWLAAQGTLAFVVMQHGRVIHEAYLNGQRREDPVTCFSISKSILATALLAALAEGRIASLDESVTRWLPELGQRDAGFARITLRHLLQMHSGIRYREVHLPNGDDAKTYYWPDLRELALQHTTIEGPPGGAFLYNNYHPLLLGLVLERATGTTVSQWVSSRLWQPAGFGAGASWSLDSEASGFEKLESGVNARAVDFARFGQLMLAGGVAESGTRVLPAALVRAATGPQGAVSLEHLHARAYYQLFWWGRRRAGAEGADAGYDFSARGNHGQVVYVSPANDVVIARFGSRYGVSSAEWGALFEQMADRLGAAVPAR